MSSKDKFYTKINKYKKNYCYTNIIYQNYWIQLGYEKVGQDTAETGCEHSSRFVYLGEG
jgi:hypothetical protein